MLRTADEKDLIIINKMFKSYFNTEIKNDVFSKIIVFEHDKILGFISYSIIYERAELNYIAVDKKYQKQGIAKELMNYMIEDTKNLDNITLEVDIKNEAAIQLYKKFGFEIEAKRENYYDDSDAYLMIKRR